MKFPFFWTCLFFVTGMNGISFAQVHSPQTTGELLAAKIAEKCMHQHYDISQSISAIWVLCEFGYTDLGKQVYQALPIDSFPPSIESPYFFRTNSYAFLGAWLGNPAQSKALFLAMERQSQSIEEKSKRAYYRRTLVKYMFFAGWEEEVRALFPDSEKRFLSYISAREAPYFWGRMWQIDRMLREGKKLNERHKYQELVDFVVVRSFWLGKMARVDSLWPEMSRSGRFSLAHSAAFTGNGPLCVRAFTSDIPVEQLHHKIAEIASTTTNPKVLSSLDSLHRTLPPMGAEYPPTHFQMVKALVQGNFPGKAVHYLQEMPEGTPHFDIAQRLITESFVRNDQIERAFEIARMPCPTCEMPPHFNLLMASLAKRDLPTARKALSSIPDDSPFKAIALGHLAVFGHEKLPPGANFHRVQTASKAVTTLPDGHAQVQALLELAEIYRKANWKVFAQTSLTEAISILEKGVISPEITQLWAKAERLSLQLFPENSSQPSYSKTVATIESLPETERAEGYTHLFVEQAKMGDVTELDKTLQKIVAHTPIQVNSVHQATESAHQKFVLLQCLEEIVTDSEVKMAVISHFIHALPSHEQAEIHTNLLWRFLENHAIERAHQYVHSLSHNPASMAVFFPLMREYAYQNDAAGLQQSLLQYLQIVQDFSEKDQLNALINLYIQYYQLGLHHRIGPGTESEKVKFLLKSL